MPAITRNISEGQLVPLLLAQDAVAASQTDVQLVVPGETTTPLVEGYVMPYAGEIVAMSYRVSTAGTAGTFTIGATVDGTEKTTTTMTVGTNTVATKRFARGAVPFALGSEIGAEITTNGSWDGTASDVAVTVWVLLYMTDG